MSVVVAGEGVRLLLCKGAPESILKRCASALVNAPGAAGQTVPLNQGTRDAVLDRMAQYGGGAGLRMRPGAVHNSVCTLDTHQQSMHCLHWRGAQEARSTRCGSTVLHADSHGLLPLLLVPLLRRHAGAAVPGSGLQAAAARRPFRHQPPG